MPRLIVLHGPDEGRQFPLPPGATFTLGRHTDNGIILNDSQISRKHLEIRVNTHGIEIIDQGSGNGTHVNGQVIRSAIITAGDRIALGQTVLLLAADTASSPSVPLQSLFASFDATPSVVRSVPAEPVEVRPAHLAVLYEIAGAINQVLDIDALLTQVLGLVVKATGADHGCFLLADTDTGALMPRVAHSAQGNEGPSISRTVIDHVWAEGRGVLVTDAGADSRFATGASIVRNKIREIIAVPLKGRHESVGVLFLDAVAPLAASTKGTVRFQADQLDLAVAVAHQAALAVEETRYYRALMNAERLAAVGQTIAALSHHIKNIMTGVRFGSDMVRTAMNESDQDLLHKGWRLVEKNQRRIDDLILDMLSYSKDREPSREPTDLAGVIQDVLEMVRGRVEEFGVTLTVQPVTVPSKVSCDPEGIHRALLNIVGNAIDAVAEAEVKVVTIDCHMNATMMKIAVSDSGPGVPEEKAEDIFKPFISSKGSRGTGLGLPVSRKILREHGGDLVVTRGVNGGAVFTLSWPG